MSAFAFDDNNGGVGIGRRASAVARASPKHVILSMDRALGSFMVVHTPGLEGSQIRRCGRRHRVSWKGSIAPAVRVGRG